MMNQRVNGNAFHFQRCVAVGILCAAIVAFGIPKDAFAETTREVRIRVVEAGSGKPVSDAIVRYRGDAHEGTWTGHGGQTAALFDITATTNSDGVAVLPATRFDANRWGLFGLNTNLDAQRLIVTRAGYRSREIISHELGPNPGMKAYLAWVTAQGVVEMTPGADPGGMNPSRRLDEQDAFIRMVRDPDAMKKMLEMKNALPPPVPALAPGKADTARKAATPATTP